MLREKIKLIKHYLFGYEFPKEILIRNGITLGQNVHIYTHQIDVKHGYLITIGNNVSLSPGVVLLAHDAHCCNFVGGLTLKLVK